MLHALVEESRRLGLDAEAGFIPKAIRWLIVFDAQGKFLSVIEQTEPGSKRKGKSFPKVPHLKFSGDTPMRQFLVDTAHYALLFGVDAPDEKLLTKHRYFLDLLRQANEADEAFGLLADRLADEDTRSAICAQLSVVGAKPADNITFAIDGDAGPRILVEQDTWHNWWRELLPTLFPQRKTCGEMRCLLSGELAEPARTHPKIKGLGGVGGKVEATLVGFNEDAFTSFGLAQSFNAAVGKQAAQQYAAALNHLIRHNSVNLAGAKVVYWYTETVPPECDPVRALASGLDFGNAALKDNTRSSLDSPRQIAQAELRGRDLLNSIREGKRPELGRCRYYALTLSGNSAREVVRDWMEGQFEELVDNIVAWFDDLAIVRRDGANLVRSHKFGAVLAAPVRELKDIAAPSVAALWHAAVGRQPIPADLAARTLARTTIDIIRDESPRHARFGLLRAYLRRKGIDMQPDLDQHLKHPAYLSGRLMATLADIQRKAFGDVGAGVVQRYYAAASTTPRLVLGRLVRLAVTGHLPKISPGGLQAWFDGQLTKVWDMLESQPPATLTLEDQTLFAMGYYQQKATRLKTHGKISADEADTNDD